MARTREHLRALPGGLPSHGAVARSTIWVMGATLVSAALGFLREVVNAHHYGTHYEMDAFLAAAVIPTILFGVFNGALVSALVPVFTDYIAQGREEEAWRLGSTVINGLLVVMTILAAAGYYFAPTFVPIVARGFNPTADAAGDRDDALADAQHRRDFDCRRRERDAERRPPLHGDRASGHRGQRR